MCNDEALAKKIDKAVFPGTQGGSLEHIIAAKAVAFYEALQLDFIEYQKQVVKNAKVLAEELINYGFNLVSGGTDNHLILVDLTNKYLSGKRAENLLGMVGITVNKNVIPFDKEKPSITSGIRIGTPAVTTRGMKEEEMKQIAKAIHYALSYNKPLSDLNRLADACFIVEDLTQRFPLY